MTNKEHIQSHKLEPEHSDTSVVNAKKSLNIQDSVTPKRRHRRKKRSSKSTELNTRNPRIPPPNVHGILLIDKGYDQTSFDVIRALRRQVVIKKAGHTGTLDPMATGLLVVCIGEGTKLVQYLTADDKTYTGEVTFGVATDTYDAMGKHVQKSPLHLINELTEDRVRNALESFKGEIEQTPPAYSAIKVNGERLYERARRGEVVDVPKRHVVIHKLELVNFTPAYQDSECFHYPKASLNIHCSKGTYIRSLAVDVGSILGLHAHLSSLRRMKCGMFNVRDAVPVESIVPDTLKDMMTSLPEALRSWPTIYVTDQQRDTLRYGQEVDLSTLSRESITDDLFDVQLTRCAIHASSGIPVALVQSTSERTLKVIRGFSPKLSVDSS